MLDIFRVNESIEKTETDEDAASAEKSDNGNKMSKFLVAMTELHR